MLRDLWNCWLITVTCGMYKTSRVCGLLSNNETLATRQVRVAGSSSRCRLLVVLAIGILMERDRDDLLSEFRKEETKATATLRARCNLPVGEDGLGKATRVIHCW
jgi:hypothetical protein